MTEHSAPGGKRAAVVINPAKGIDEEFRTVFTELCRAHHWDEPLWLETSVEDAGNGQAREALEEGVDLVLAAGGDGTVRCVAEVLAGTDTPMGIVPLGTGNLLARNLGLDVTDPTEAAKEALTGMDRRTDVVRAVIDRSGDERLFLVMAGLGFDAVVMADTNDNLKDRVGWLAYVDAGIRKLPGKPAKARIAIDGARPLPRRLRSIMAGNCGKLQGGLELFPGAKIDDGVLDIMTVAPSGTFGWLGVLTGLLNRGRSKDPAVEYFQGKTIEISTDEPQAIQLDGDHLGEATHLSMRIEPGALLIRMAPA